MRNTFIGIYARSRDLLVVIEITGFDARIRRVIRIVGSRFGDLLVKWRFAERSFVSRIRIFGNVLSFLNQSFKTMEIAVQTKRKIVLVVRCLPNAAKKLTGEIEAMASS